MLIDSGASVTVLPPWIGRCAGLLTDRVLEVESFDGNQSQRPIVQVRLHLGGIAFLLECILHDEGEEAGILGRDVLNLLHLVLDGPRCSWTLSTPV